MNATYNAICTQRGPWWVGWVEEIPGVNAQEKTQPEFMASLSEILSEALGSYQQMDRAILN
jgi:predicted RNase H-like HicB family nuclease